MTPAKPEPDSLERMEQAMAASKLTDEETWDIIRGALKDVSFGSTWPEKRREARLALARLESLRGAERNQGMSDTIFIRRDGDTWKEYRSFQEAKAGAGLYDLGPGVKPGVVIQEIRIVRSWSAVEAVLEQTQGPPAERPRLPPNGLYAGGSETPVGHVEGHVVITVDPKGKIPLQQVRDLMAHIVRVLHG